MRARVILTLILICAVCFLGVPIPAFASRHAAVAATTWQQYDTALYVVSTLNLFHDPSGRALTGMWQHRGGVHQYDVFLDADHANLYFIELKRADGTTVGAFAYELGWPKPRLIEGRLPGLRPDPTSDSITLEKAYGTDHKVLLASFSSTLPASRPPESKGRALLHANGFHRYGGAS